MGHNREFASHGYITFALDHHDGSCMYTEKEDGTPLYFDFKRAYDYEHKNK